MIAVAVVDARVAREVLRDRLARDVAHLQPRASSASASRRKRRLFVEKTISPPGASSAAVVGQQRRRGRAARRRCARPSACCWRTSAGRGTRGRSRPRERRASSASQRRTSARTKRCAAPLGEPVRAHVALRPVEVDGRHVDGRRRSSPRPRRRTRSRCPVYANRLRKRRPAASVAQHAAREPVVEEQPGVEVVGQVHEQPQPRLLDLEEAPRLGVALVLRRAALPAPLLEHHARRAPRRAPRARPPSTSASRASARAGSTVAGGAYSAHVRPALALGRRRTGRSRPRTRAGPRRTRASTSRPCGAPTCRGARGSCAAGSRTSRRRACVRAARASPAPCTTRPSRRRCRRASRTAPLYSSYQRLLRSPSCFASSGSRGEHRRLPAVEPLAQQPAEERVQPAERRPRRRGAGRTAGSSRRGPAAASGGRRRGRSRSRRSKRTCSAEARARARRRARGRSSAASAS